MAKNKNNPLVIILIALVLVLGGVAFYFYEDSLNGSYEERLEAANELLENNCDAVADISAEFIKRDLLADIMHVIAINRCGCVKDVIAPKLADKYSLSELKEFSNKRIEQIMEVKDMIRENNVEVTNCFRIKKKNKTE